MNKLALLFVVFVAFAAANPIETVDPIERESDLACHGCTLVVTVIDRWVASNKTISQITNLLDEFCQLFNGTDTQKTCERVVKFGVERVIKFLQDKYPPEKVCQMIGLCPKTMMVQARTGPVVCEGCKIMVDAIYTWVNSPVLREKIYTLANKMCYLFKKTDFQPVCEDILDYGIDKVIAYAEQKLNPEFVCGLVKACPAKAPSVIDTLIDPLPREGNLACKGCTVVVSAIEQWVASNKTVTQIIVLLDEFCNLFNGTIFQAPCDNVIKFGVDKIIKMLEEKFPPEKVCQMIGLCPKSMVVQARTGPVVCEGCKIMVNAIHTWVNSPIMREKIYTLANKMCTLFKKTDFQPVCEDILDYGIDKVIEFVQQKLSAEYVCGLITLCPKNKMEIPQPAVCTMAVSEDREGKVICKGCITLVNLVETLIQSNTTVTKIKELARQACNMFNGTMFYNVCIRTVDTSIDKIIQLVTDKIEPEVICSKLGLCDAPQVNVLIDDIDDIDTAEDPFFEDVMPDMPTTDMDLILAELRKISDRQEEMHRHMAHRHRHHHRHHHRHNRPHEFGMMVPEFDFDDMFGRIMDDMSVSVKIVSAEEPTQEPVPPIAGNSSSSPETKPHFFSNLVNKVRGFFAA